MSSILLTLLKEKCPVHLLCPVYAVNSVKGKVSSVLQQSLKERRRIFIGLHIYYTYQEIIIALRDIPTRFLASSFFQHSNPPGPLTNGLKCFRFRPDNWIFRKKISPQYDTVGSNSRPTSFFNIFTQAFKGAVSQNKCGFLFY